MMQGLQRMKENEESLDRSAETHKGTGFMTTEDGN